MSVLVVTGAGGMGVACARRVGSGREVVIADAKQERLETVAGDLTDEGFRVQPFHLDVSDEASVARLAAFAAELGDLATIVHTAGLSPTMAAGQRILSVNLLGTALMIDAFEPLVGPGTVGVFIASMAGHLWPADQQLDPAIARARPADTVAATGLRDDIDPETAYMVSKRGVMLRVAAAAPAWGARGARIVSVSPGMISTEMGRQENDAQPAMRDMLASSPVPRLGTSTDIAEAVAWLASPDAAFITGTDLLVDGGVIASLQP